MWRWRELLVPVSAPVSLGEGWTPLVRLGGERDAWVKDERANPTGTFKDRLASAAVSWACDKGADTVAVASTGNAALATAAYAAAAGLRCIVVARRGRDGGVPASIAPALEATGADIVLTDTSRERWDTLNRGVSERGWFPISNYLSPPVSSHPVGVRAYRTIAYEIVEQMGWTAPDWVVVPVSRGDSLSALVAGFEEMSRLGWIRGTPRPLAVVRFPSLRNGVEQHREQPSVSDPPDRVAAVSISDPQATAVAAHAVARSGGEVLVMDDDGLATASREAAARGWLLARSSAAALAGVSARRQRGETRTIVAVATASARRAVDDSPA